ncbi:MAG: hypothetical protein LBK61_06105 [Spirochaetaceae bacterium]|jgi:hypothetical protein|nr:hypothetical protein [Spirochaetaceae bacterium]
MNSSRSDWFPATRTGQLAMVKTWIEVCTAKQKGPLRGAKTRRVFIPL